MSDLSPVDAINDLIDQVVTVEAPKAVWIWDAEGGAWYYADGRIVRPAEEES